MERLKKILMAVAVLMVTVDANAWTWMSPYAYCLGNPVNFIDPDGERPKASEAALMAAYAYKDKPYFRSIIL